jgi:hypothetical protein
MGEPPPIPGHRRPVNEIDAVPGRLRNPLRLTRRPFSLGGAASHLGGLALYVDVRHEAPYDPAEVLALFLPARTRQRDG